VVSKNPPQLIDTIILPDRVHTALVSLSNGSSINVLVKGIEGEITHITIYAPAGFPRPEAVEPVAGTMLGGRNIPWHAFQRRR
jgi:hypothetical protein